MEKEERVNSNAPDLMGYVLTTATNRNPDGISILYQDEVYTYRRLSSEVNRLANALIHLGISKGEKIALYLPNIPEYVVSYFACLKIGAVIVPINTRFQSPEIRYVLENADVVAIIVSDSYRETFESVSSRPEKLREAILVTHSPRKEEGVIGWNYHDYHRLVASASGEEPSAAVVPDDPVGIFYTSGTTGVPKGVVLTHKKALAGIDAWIDGLNLTDRSRSLVIAPFFHIAFNAFVFSLFRAGGSAIILESFQLKNMLKEIERSRPTFMFAVPSVYIMMVDYPQVKEYDLSSLESIVYGAAPMPVEVIHRVRALFKGSLYNAYGQTETSSAISRLLPEFAVSKAGSVGTPLKGVEVAILDDDDLAVPAETVGEICCRGENILKEYYKMPEVTAKKLRSGWLHTGDLGYLDAEGFLYIIDRKDDIIICRGEKVSPKEVEEVLYTHPDVLDAAVVGMSDRVKGEVVIAFVVPKAGREINATSIRRLCRERLADYKVPRHIAIIESIPRNPSGKILRHELRKRGVEMSSSIVPY